MGVDAGVESYGRGQKEQGGGPEKRIAHEQTYAAYDRRVLPRRSAHPHFPKEFQS